MTLSDGASRCGSRHGDSVDDGWSAVVGCGWLLGVGVVVAVLAAGGAGPGLAAVGVAAHGPVAFVLEAVVVSAEAVQVVRGGAAAGGERFAVGDVGGLGGAGGARGTGGGGPPAGGGGPAR